MTIADERLGSGHEESALMRPSALALVPAESLASREPAARPTWLERYRRSVIALDLLVASVVGLVPVLVDVPGGSAAAVDRLWLGALIPVLWMASASLRSTYDPRVFGTGSEEYRRVGRAGTLLLVGVVFTSSASGLQLPQHLVLFWVPVLTAAVCGSRYLARRVLQRARVAGRC